MTATRGDVAPTPVGAARAPLPRGRVGDGRSGERGRQGVSADFSLVSSWVDPGLADPAKPYAVTTGTAPLDKGLMWGPALTFANRRDLTAPIEGVLTVYNTGAVTVVQAPPPPHTHTHRSSRRRARGLE